MLVGRDNLVKIFKRLADGDKLSHGYLFFGEPQVGKFAFAREFANYLENGDFGEPLKILEETLIIAPDEKNSIGIDAVKSLAGFLYQKPIFSKRRTAIIRDAQNLTSEAQNAALKIIEEPPFQSLIIFVVSDGDLLLPTLSSRLQKVYFPRVSAKKIADLLLVLDKNLGKKKAEQIALASFGRPGRAVDAINLREESEKTEKIVRIFLTGSLNKDFLDAIIENNLDKFFEFLIIELKKDPIKNFKILKEALKRIALIKMFNVNKRLQLKAMLTN